MRDAVPFAHKTGTGLQGIALTPSRWLLDCGTQSFAKALGPINLTTDTRMS